MGKGSGSVTTFSLADGFITIDQHTEMIEAGTSVPVTLLDRRLRVADLVVIGSHCVGLDYLLSLLRREGFPVKTMHVGSTGGLAAAKRGECDIAGMHLLDPATGEYNRTFVTDDLELVTGYRRHQCLVFRPGDPRFSGKSAHDAVAAALADPACTMVNRNAGSGTRILIDQLLENAAAGLTGGPSAAGLEVAELQERTDDQSVLPTVPPGYGIQARSHNAVAAAVSQGRADWGLAIDTVARSYGLAIIAVRDEHYDFVIPRTRRDRPAVQRFRQLLQEAAVRERLGTMGFGV
jgi:putative molybdopterin biosynthesis protein